MLSIGRFADATGLTVKALRHYDEIGLLAPAQIDPGNGYRYYAEAQIEDAVTIRRLRALELPLDEIHDLVHADAGTTRDRLAAHGFRVAEEVRDKHSLLIELGAILEGGGEEVELEIRDIPELRLAALIQHRPLIDPEGVTQMLRTVHASLAARGFAPAGPPTALFRSGDGNGRHLVEAGFPVADEVEGDGTVAVTVYPAAQAATVMHLGSYDELHVTAQRFISTVLGQGLRFGQAIRIEYLAPGERARIVWPLASS
jgi:DNA-binding transcriptional MerR regulator